MKIAGVLGWPIAHSRSPLLHRYWIEQHGVDGAYLPFAVSPERFDAAITGLIGLGFAGVNVTLPHKEVALSIADTASAAAQAIGAANMLTVRNDQLHADNSDAFGFAEHLFSTVTDEPTQLSPALLLGAGGAARAAIFALNERGVGPVTVANRTVERAVALQKQFPHIHIISMGDVLSSIDKYRLIVNTTSVGLDEEKTPIEVSNLHPDCVIYDTVYSPLDTLLLRTARARGLCVVDGLGMLMHQARAGAQEWFGIDAVPDRALRDLLSRSLA